MNITPTITKVSEIRHKAIESYYFVTVVADSCQAARERLSGLSSVTIEYAGSGFDYDHTFKVSTGRIR